MSHFGTQFWRTSHNNQIGVETFNSDSCIYLDFVERGSSAVECQTRNQASQGSNPALLTFRSLGIIVLSMTS